MEIKTIKNQTIFNYIIQKRYNKIGNSFKIIDLKKLNRLKEFLGFITIK